jgi:DNA (cytosine-5)-methyltransferase 1
MKVLDLFSGIGGFALGLERAGMETVAFCEYDEKARLVLKKHWPDVPMYNDVRTLTGEQLEKDGITDIGLICGGYPCQSFSVAGKRKGQADDRYLWPEFFRLIQETRPTWVIAENVAGHINMGLEDVLADLESEGYNVQTFLIPACAVDAFHRRDRVWIIANSDSSISGNQWQDEMLDHRQMDKRKTFSVNNGNTRIVAHSDSVNWSPNEGKPNAKADGRDKSSGGGEVMAYAECKRQQGQRINERSSNTTEDKTRQASWFINGSERRSQPGNWLPEPSVGRVVDGVPGRVDRLKQLGNAVVTQIPEVIGRFIMEIENGT